MRAKTIIRSVTSEKLENGVLPFNSNTSHVVLIEMLFNLFDPWKKGAGQDHYLATTKLFGKINKTNTVVLLAEF